MRKELYKTLCERLTTLYATPDGLYGVVEPGAEVPEGWERLIRHIDLWNHNVEFIEQEENWERPAVFVEFCPIRWNAVVPGVEYRAVPQIRLHVVTDWQGSASDDSTFMEDALKLLDISGVIHGRLTCLYGKEFMEFDLVETQTNHNHEDIVESIETYQCVVIRSLK